MDMRFGTWNVRSLCRAGSLGTVSKELSKLRLDLVGVQEGSVTQPAEHILSSPSRSANYSMESLHGAVSSASMAISKLKRLYGRAVSVRIIGKVVKVNTCSL
jgi:hypothetical protein